MARDPGYGSEQRRLEPATDDRGLARWYDEVVYYGAWQFVALTVPAVWILFQSPVDRVPVLTGAVLAMVTAPVCVGLARNGYLPGDGWPAVESIRLGTNTGFRRLFTRGLHLNAVLLAGSFGGTLALKVAGTPLALYATVVLTTGVGVATLPRILPQTTVSLAGRGAWYALGYGLAWWLAQPFDTTQGFGSPIVTLPVLVAVAALDLGIGGYGVAAGGEDPR